MKYLKMAGWDKWQTYRTDRGAPPWIKVHRILLRNPEWLQLSDAERGHLVSLWLLAADKEGLVPADPKDLKKILSLDKEPDIERLMALEFIERDATVTPERRHDDATMTPQVISGQVISGQDISGQSNVPRKRGTTYTPEFEAIWEAYPKRLGGNPKKTAAAAYQARIKAGDTTYEQALASVNAYKAACEAKGKVGTEYVMQTSSYFGQKEGFREPWLTTCETVNPEQQAALRRKIADKRRMMQYWINEGDIAAARECAVTPELQQEFDDMVQSREIFAAQRQEGGE